MPRDLLAKWFITRSRRGAPPPVRTGNEVTPYIEYAAYYAAVGAAIASASEGTTVLVAGWGLELETPVGRGETPSSIGEMLKKAGAQRARVRVLLSGHVGNPSRPVVTWLAQQPGCAAIEDDRLRLPGCFHQKAVVVAGREGVVAFVGGMDFGRDRLAEPATKRPPWHDVQVGVRGEAAADVYATLAGRWESHPSARGERLPRIAVDGGARRGPGRAVQLVRTYGNPRTGVPLTTLRPETANTVAGAARRLLGADSEFAFSPMGESAIHDLLIQAIRATMETIYVEDQYFVASVAIGGAEELLQALADTIAKPTFKHMLVLTTGVGTVQPELYQVNRRRRDLVRRIAANHLDRISVWAYKGGQDRCNWLHSKTWLFDDTMAVIGSANFNRRGLSHDGELDVGVLDLENPTRGWVHSLRTQLWLKHLPSPTRPVTPDQVEDFESGRALWVDTKDTLLSRMDVEVGDPYQPDHLILCDAPMPPPGLGRFYRNCACGKQSLAGALVRSFDNQWKLFIDPDGT